MSKNVLITLLGLQNFEGKIIVFIKTKNNDSETFSFHLLKDLNANLKQLYPNDTIIKVIFKKRSSYTSHSFILK